MTVVDVKDGAVPAAATDTRRPAAAAERPPRDLQRTFRLVLATVWLLDAALQIQPMMFTRGSHGFSGMLERGRRRKPGIPIPLGDLERFERLPPADPEQYDLRLDPVPDRLRNRLPADVQARIGPFHRLGGRCLVVRRVRRRDLPRRRHSFGGGPGGVLSYAVLAVLLWPSSGSDEPFVAARTVGVNAAKAIWVLVVGPDGRPVVGRFGRSPRALHDLVAVVDVGQPGWVAHLDRSSESLFLHHGSTVAVLLAVVCVVVAAGVFATPPVAQATVVLAIVVFALISLAVQDVGGILAGGATDPNSGPLVILLALTYWPSTRIRRGAGRSRI